MAGFGGAGGMNPQAMMKMVQKFQDAQEEIQNERIEGTAGGGMVTATVTGSNSLVALSINPEVVDPNDVEMLEDLVLSAIQAAQEKAQEVTKQKMMPLTGGLKIPGLF